MRGQYLPYEGDPLLYAMGPGHLFFGRNTVGTPAPNSPATSSPLANPATPTSQPTGVLPATDRNDATGPVEEFVNPNVNNQAGWVGTVGLGLANMLGGPALGGLFGAGLGANMAQAVNQEFTSRGLEAPFDVGQAALSGAARGALGSLGQIAGFGQTFADLQAIASMIGNPMNQAQLNAYAGRAAAAPEGTFALALGELASNSSKGSSTFSDGGAKDAASPGGASKGSTEGTPEGNVDTGGWGGGYGNPGAGDAGFGMGDPGGVGMYAEGGLVGVHELAGGGKIAVGPGGGLDDLIPTSIDGRRAARLSDGEFVIPADVVSMFGDGSTRAGSQRLYDLVRTVRKEKTGTTRQAGELPVGRILERIFG